MEDKCRDCIAYWPHTKCQRVKRDITLLPIDHGMPGALVQLVSCLTWHAVPVPPSDLNYLPFFRLDAD